MQLSVLMRKMNVDNNVIELISKNMLNNSSLVDTQKEVKVISVEQIYALAILIAKENMLDTIENMSPIFYAERIEMEEKNYLHNLKVREEKSRLRKENEEVGMEYLLEESDYVEEITIKEE